MDLVDRLASLQKRIEYKKPTIYEVDIIKNMYINNGITLAENVIVKKMSTNLPGAGFRIDIEFQDDEYYFRCYSKRIKNTTYIKFTKKIVYQPHYKMQDLIEKIENMI